MSSRRWTAPMRRVLHPEKEQCRRRGQFCPTVQSAARSELLTAPERDRPEKNASCGYPDKGPTERQGHPPTSRSRGTTPNAFASRRRDKEFRSPLVISEK